MGTEPVSTPRHRDINPTDEPEEVGPLREAMVRELRDPGAL